MRIIKVLAVLGLIALGAAAGWFFGRGTNQNGSAPTNGRRVLYYQSPMHPWIKSDRPGNCTICGMKLTPVYEGEKALESSANIVALSSNSINVVNVQSDTAQIRTLQRTLEVAGRIETEETRYRVISAWVDGRIEKLFVNYLGAEVEQGQPLALLYSPALLTAEREYLTVAAQTNFNATPQLAREHDQLLEGARQRLKRLGLTEGQIADLPAKGAGSSTTQIVAPIGGTVITRAVFEGQYVKEGDKLFEIADRSKMWFRFEVYEQDLPFVHVGDIVQVRGPALNGRTFEGPVAFIDPTINDATRAARVRVELDNPADASGHRVLDNGLFATGSIHLRSAPVLAIPRTALIDPGDQPRVYVDHGGGAYEQRQVSVGRRGMDYVQVLSGLEAGEKVVTSGNLLLDSQAQIREGGVPHDHGSHTSTAVPGRTNAPVEPVNSHAGHAVAPSADQVRVLQQYLAAFDKIAAALASDDLAGFNRERETAGHEAEKAAHALHGEFKVPAEKILASLPLPEARDLAAARANFLPLSVATADLARAVRQAGGKIEAKVYRCPMYPESGKTAWWVQVAGPLRNPFFGSEMLDCGVEVK